MTGFLALLLATGAAASQKNIDLTATLKGRNLVLVSIDTLRADHLGAYGYARPTSPSLDALARESLLFERAYSQSPATAPSHMTLLTGVLPSVHRVVSWHSLGEVALSQRLPTLATLLRRAGYATYAHTGGGNVHDAFGFDQGFDTFSMTPWGDMDLATHALGTVAARAGGPFFFFAHTYQVHAPYVPPVEYARLFVDPRYAGGIVSSREELVRRAGSDAWEKMPGPFWGPVNTRSPADIAHLVNLYDAGIRRMDAQLAGFLTRFRGLGLDRNTVLLLTSDHGEEFMEHGGLQHGTRLYEEQLHVPLLVRLPMAAAAGRVPDVVRLLDVVPTLLGLLGVSSPDHIQGQLLPGLLGPPARRQPVYAEESAGGLQGLRIGDLKYLRHGEHEQLFDLASDPGELRDLITPDQAYVWRRRASRILEGNLVLAARFQSSGERPRLDPETRRHLEALGYVGAGP